MIDATVDLDTNNDERKLPARRNCKLKMEKRGKHWHFGETIALLEFMQSNRNLQALKSSEWPLESASAKYWIAAGKHVAKVADLPRKKADRIRAKVLNLSKQYDTVTEALQDTECPGEDTDSAPAYEKYSNDCYNNPLQMNISSTSSCNVSVLKPVSATSKDHISQSVTGSAIAPIVIQPQVSSAMKSSHYCMKSETVGNTPDHIQVDSSNIVHGDIHPEADNVCDGLSYQRQPVPVNMIRNGTVPIVIEPKLEYLENSNPEYLAVVINSSIHSRHIDEPEITNLETNVTPVLNKSQKAMKRSLCPDLPSNSESEAMEINETSTVVDINATMTVTKSGRKVKRNRKYSTELYTETKPRNVTKLNEKKCQVVPRYRKNGKIQEVSSVSSLKERQVEKTSCSRYMEECKMEIPITSVPVQKTRQTMPVIKTMVSEVALQGKSDTEERSTCIYCQKHFMGSSSLSSHVNREHPPEKPYKCTLCNKTFSYHSHAVAHLKRTHKMQMDSYNDFIIANELCPEQYNPPLPITTVTKMKSILNMDAILEKHLQNTVQQNIDQQCKMKTEAVEICTSNVDSDEGLEPVVALQLLSDLEEYDTEFQIVNKKQDMEDET